MEMSLGKSQRDVALVLLKEEYERFHSLNPGEFNEDIIELAKDAEDDIFCVVNDLESDVDMTLDYLYKKIGHAEACASVMSHQVKSEELSNKLYGLYMGLGNVLLRTSQTPYDE